MKLDKIDYSILKILQERGRVTNAQLASEVGLSPAPTLERVRKLEVSGMIQSYHALVDPEKIGLAITVFIEVKLNYHSHFKIEQFIDSIKAYQKFIVEKLSKIDGVGHIQSKVVLSTIKNEMVLPISDDLIENQKR